MRVLCIPTLLGLALVACQSTAPKPAPARYIVTTTPLAVRGVSRGLCIAVEPTDPQGIWWWEPGRSGCSSRSTGPGVFHAEHSVVTAPSQTGAIAARFRLQLMGDPRSTAPDFADVAIVLEDGAMVATASGARVATERRNDLEVPE